MTSVDINWEPLAQCNIIVTIITIQSIDVYVHISAALVANENVVVWPYYSYLLNFEDLIWIYMLKW